MVKWRDRDSAFVDIALGIERVVQNRLEESEEKHESLQSESTDQTTEYLYLDLPGSSSSSVSQPQSLPYSPPAYISPEPQTLPYPFLPGTEHATFSQSKLESLRSAWEREEDQRRERERIYYHKALVAYEQALRQNNQDGKAYQGKGYALLRLGYHEKALEAFEQSIALEPQPSVYVSIGNILTTLKSYHKALIAYKQAIAMDTSYASAYFEIAQMFSLVGKKQKAKEYFQQAKSLGYED